MVSEAPVTRNARPGSGVLASAAGLRGLHIVVVKSGVEPQASFETLPNSVPMRAQSDDSAKTYHVTSGIVAESLAATSAVPVRVL